MNFARQNTAIKEDAQKDTLRFVTTSAPNADLVIHVTSSMSP